MEERRSESGALRHASIATVVLAATLLIEAVLAVTVTVLVSLWWLPSAPEADRDLLPRRNSTALTVRDLQPGALTLVAGTGVITTIVAAKRRSFHRARTNAALSLVTVVLAGATLFMRRLVLWDQVARPPWRRGSRGGSCCCPIAVRISSNPR